MCKDESREIFIILPTETGLFGKFGCYRSDSDFSEGQVHSIIPFGDNEL